MRSDSKESRMTTTTTKSERVRVNLDEAYLTNIHNSLKKKQIVNFIRCLSNLILVKSMLIILSLKLRMLVIHYRFYIFLFRPLEFLLPQSL